MEMPGEKKVHRLGYCLKAPQLDMRNELVMYKFDVTANLITTPSEKCPSVVFDLQNRQDKYSWEIMRSCCHRNILQLSMVKERASSAEKEDDKNEPDHIFLEPYTGNLMKYIETVPLGYCVGTVSMIPSIQLKQIFSQIIDGLSYLFSLGKYHGNMSLQNTYYYLGGSEPVVKLANFKKKAGSVLNNQLDDCVAVGLMLEEISKLANERNKVVGALKLDVCQIDHLSIFLKNIDRNSLPVFKERVKNHFFFWDKRDRKRFLIFDVQRALKVPGFAAAIRQVILFADPWTNESFDGYLNAMNQHRSSHHVPLFNGNDTFEYVQFASGSYVHEAQLKDERKVHRSADEAIYSRNPQICYQIKTCMPF